MSFYKLKTQMFQINKQTYNYERFSIQGLRQELDKAEYKASVELLNNYNYATIQG